MKIRGYVNDDKPTVIKLLEMNIPEFFAASEVADFENYLIQQLEDFFLVEDKERIIGAGGINYFPKINTARLSWDFIHPDFKGQGIGKDLTEFRIELIKKNPEIKTIEVRTSQLAYQFYEKLGFKLIKTEPDFWAEGFDLYHMEMNNIN